MREEGLGATPGIPEGADTTSGAGIGRLGNCPWKGFSCFDGERKGGIWRGYTECRAIRSLYLKLWLFWSWSSLLRSESRGWSEDIITVSLAESVRSLVVPFEGLFSFEDRRLTESGDDSFGDASSNSTLMLFKSELRSICWSTKKVLTEGSGRRWWGTGRFLTRGLECIKLPTGRRAWCLGNDAEPDTKFPIGYACNSWWKGSGERRLAWLWRRGPFIPGSTVCSFKGVLLCVSGSWDTGVIMIMLCGSSLPEEDSLPRVLLASSSCWFSIRMKNNE